MPNYKIGDFTKKRDELTLFSLQDMKLEKFEQEIKEGKKYNDLSLAFDENVQADFIITDYKKPKLIYKNQSHEIAKKLRAIENRVAIICHTPDFQFLVKPTSRKTIQTYEKDNQGIIETNIAWIGGTNTIFGLNSWENGIGETNKKDYLGLVF